jgi:hypothetical protein
MTSDRTSMSHPAGSPRPAATPVAGLDRRQAIRRELIGLSGIVERNTYLIRHYVWWELAFFVWTIANTLTIVFIAQGVEASGGHLDVDRTTTTLLVGAVLWSYLGIIFEILTETVAWGDGKGRSSTRSWPPCHARCTSVEWACSPSSTACSARPCCLR